MKKNYQIPFPRFIDRPKMVVIFEVDEAFLWLACTILLMLAGMLLEIPPSAGILGGLSIGVIPAIMYHKFKKKYPNGYAWHLLYRKGIFHPVIDNKKIKIERKDIRNGLKVLPTGTLHRFYE